MFHSSLVFGFFLEIVIGQPHGISAQAQANMQPKTHGSTQADFWSFLHITPSFQPLCFTNSSYLDLLEH